MDDKDKIIEGLKSELERAVERERDYKESRTAMLYLLEDLDKTTEEVLRADKEWEATFDAITDPLFIHDKNYNVVRANKAYQALAGIPFKNLIGKPYYEAFPRMDKPFDICLKAKKAGGELKGEEDTEIKIPEINRIFKVRYYPIKDSEGAHLYSIHILEDITAAKRFESRLRQEVGVTTSLLSIAEATARTKDIDRLMHEVVRAVSRAVRSDICLTYLRERGTNIFNPAQAWGLAAPEIPLFRTEPLDEDVWFVRSAVVRKDSFILHAPFDPPESQKAQAAENPLAWVRGASTMLVIPLVSRIGATGLIIAMYKAKTELTETDRRIVRGISHEVSSAVEEARLYKESVDKAMELSHKIETIKAMHEIDKQVLSTLKPQEILETAVMTISRVIPCDRATVALIDREKEGFIYAAGFGVHHITKGALVPFKDTTTTEVVNTGRPQYVADLREIKDLPAIERGFLEAGHLSHIRVPLVSKGEVIGVLSIGSRRPSAFTPEDLSTLEKFSSQIGVALENAKLITDLQELFLSTIKTLSKAIDAKSHWTLGHSERVTAFALRIGGELGLGDRELKTLELAGLLHDIGKLGTYESVLDKPGKLTEEELGIIRQHPAKGAEILTPIKQLNEIIPAIKYHHESYDGKGYPEGLKGTDIPLMARILAVADTVDAMGADRPYRKGRPMEAIVEELKRCSGTQFDPEAVKAFLNVIEYKMA